MTDREKRYEDNSREEEGYVNRVKNHPDILQEALHNPRLAARREEAERRRRKTRVNFWLVLGVCILVVLLLVWLTIADLWGDTDVAAAIMPLTSKVALCTL